MPTHSSKVEMPSEKTEEKTSKTLKHTPAMRALKSTQTGKCGIEGEVKRETEIQKERERESELSEGTPSEEDIRPNTKQFRPFLFPLRVHCQTSEKRARVL